MENRRYRNGNHQVRGNARRPFRHARRIQKLANSATAHSSLLPDHYFIWDPTEPVATRPLAWQRGTSVAYYTHDGNKNVSEVIASNNDVAAHYEYAPFGALTVSRGVSAAANPWRFSSEYAEDDTATVYYNYRHYEPVAGRWMTRDPIEEWGGLNMLAFVCNCSVSTVDIAGMSIGDYIPVWSTFMSAIDLVIGHIPGQSSVDYPFVSPSECKCNEEAAEASCIKAVEIKAIEYISEALKQLVTGVIVDAIVSVVGIKANFIVGGILAANALVDMGLKSTIYSKVMSGSNEAMKHNCDCGQYTK